jgi:ABC-type amino acid transport substrate-binding protein
MPYRLLSFAVLLAVLAGGVLAVPGRVAAQAPAPDGRDTLVVAVKEAPPFVMQRSGGAWAGLSIDLWETVAREMDRPYTFRQATLAEMIDGVAAGRYDAALAAITMTAEREQRVDFSYPYYTSGLGVAVRAETGGAWTDGLQRLFSSAFLGVVLALAGLLFVVGALVWLFERKKNPDHFGGSVGQGLASGFWWSAVTMTTVGYGDKAPLTLGGRLVALVWMFAALIIASSFTAAITTVLTTSQLAVPVRTAADLDEVQLGAVVGTSGTRYLEGERLDYASFPTPEAALRALQSEQVEAVVYDAPILHHLLAGDTTVARAGQLLPRRLTQEFYGVALPEDSALREPINLALLRTLDTPDWQGVRYRYLGEQ